MAKRRRPSPRPSRLSQPPEGSRRRPGDPLEPPEPPEPTGPHRPERPDLEDLEPVDAEPTGPGAGPSDPNLKPSITSWTRLEPRCREADMRTTLAARVFDPLWLLARQWQVGEFQAEDVGMPVLARVRARSALLSRCYLGEIPANTPTKGAPYDPTQMPLEVMVERQHIRSTPAPALRLWKLRVEAGLHFLRMLEAQPLAGNYRAAFTSRFALQSLEPQQLEGADEETMRFVQTMVGRALDGRRLEEACRADPGAMPRDPALRIAVGDRAEVEQTAARWLTWFDGLFSEPSAGAADAWMPARMEYAVTVAGRLSDEPLDERPLTATEFYDGHLDWNSFDLDLEVNLGTQGDRTVRSIVETTVPAPVTFRGSPAPRFWEFEDAQIEYGLLPVGRTDLAQLLMIEYASSYGNDWFLVPLTLPVGSLTSIDSLVVTDSFGVRTLLRPIGDRGLPPAHWRMFQLAYIRRPGDEGIPGAADNLFFLPPALGRSLESAALEDVLLMRDEMANMAWAIERTIESPVEQPNPYSEVFARAADDGLPPSAGTTTARYLLSSTVPPNWVPLLPVQLVVAPDTIVSRLKRGAVLQPDGSQKVHTARGRLLNTGAALLMHDEEVPREGVRVTRHYQMTRWIDGTTWVWLAHRKQVGRGEGSSGLQFDRLLT